MALPLDEASVKIRTGPPDDAGTPDAGLGLWAGELPLAFAQDSAAQRLAVSGLEASMDQDLALHERMFFGLPLSHAEDPVSQERGLAYAERLTAEAPTGVRHVLVNGVPIRVDEAQVESLSPWPGTRPEIG